MHIPFVHPALNKEIDIQSYHVIDHGRVIEHRSKSRDGAHVKGLWCFVWPNMEFNYYGPSMNMGA